LTSRAGTAADLSALLSHISRSWGGKFSDGDDKRLSSALNSVAIVLDYYPVYLKASLSGQNIRSLRWNKTLSIFLFFLSEFVTECWFLTNYPKVRQPTVDNQLRKWKDLQKKGKISEEIFQAREKSAKWSLGVGSFVKNNLSKEKIADAACLMKDPDDRYEDTFTGRLQFASIVIADPHLAGWLKNYREFCRQHHIKARGNSGDAVNPTGEHTQTTKPSSSNLDALTS
jgi:hypothetical protein